MSKFRANIFCYNILQTTSEPKKMSKILENKVLQKSKFSKDVDNEKFPPKMTFFDKKQFRKILLILDREN